jgi:Mlc titration factor MtfA (ptsG expression regulator)
VFTEEFRRLRQLAEDPVARYQQAEEQVLDFYGASEPAEFFAVATEAFFERPHALAARHPQLYEQLHVYYRVDPRLWQH